MTLEELKIRCENQNFKYAYGKFATPVEPPHLVSLIVGSTNFAADNLVYHKKENVQLDYTYVAKNLEEQNKIEDIVLKDVVWNKTEEIYLSDEDVWQVSYFFEI